jgi:hypothetical protein
MKLSGTIAGILLALVGGIWFFQGIGMLPGSFMSGQSKWAVYGGIAFLAGVVIVVLSRRA